MSSITLPVPALAGASPRFRAALNPFLLTYLLTAGSFVLCGYLWGAAGFDMLVVGMGWPHVILGFLFYFNKVLKNEGSHRIHFVLLLGSTLAIGLYHSFIPITTVIYLYFVFHAFRDEIFIYYQRLANHKFSGPVLTRDVWILIGIVALLAGLSQINPRPAMRQMQVPLAGLTGKTLSISFPPVEDSAGHDYYFTLVTNQEGVSPFEAYAYRKDVIPGGELLIGEKPWQAKDLEFQAIYDGTPGGTPAGQQTGEERVPFLLGGYPVGQTFRADRDHLSGISVPITVKRELPEDLKLEFRLESPFFVYHPYAYHLALGLIGLVLSVLALLQIPRSLFVRMPALRFAIPGLALFAAAAALMKMARFNALESPLFFAFLVVFHYFSWYVFYVEKIHSRPAGATVRAAERPFDRFLQKVTTRNGFLTFIVIMNVVSFSAAYAYQVLQLSPALRFGFDLRYFLYFLVFHVTMSFAPKHAH